MSESSSVWVQIAGLALAWIVVATSALIGFGWALDSHSDMGLALAFAVAIAGVAGLVFLGLRIARLSRVL